MNVSSIALFGRRLLSKTIGICAVVAFVGTFPLGVQVLVAQGHGGSAHYITGLQINDGPEGTGRAFPLSKSIPDDVEVDTKIDLQHALFAQVRYGSPDSIRVAVLAIPVDDQVTLYVDANRDRKFNIDDLMATPGPIWHLEIDHEITTELPESPIYVPRDVEIEYLALSQSVSFKTCGRLEQELTVGEATFHAAFTDANGNGSFGDRDDRIFVDLDRDGEWNLFQEQFASRPVISIQDQRYSLSRDERSNRFALEPLKGSGTVHFELKFKKDQPIESYFVVLAGRDQGLIAISDKDGDVLIPTGEYSIEHLVIATKPMVGNPAWSYVFRQALADPPRYKVAADQRCNISLIEGRMFELHVLSEKEFFEAGDRFTVRPSLTLENGLYLSNCSLGHAGMPHLQQSVSAVIRLNCSGETLATVSSGFK